MIMKSFYRIAAAVFLITLCLAYKSLPASGANETALPKGKEGLNVILIIIDDLRPDHLGCYGYPKQISPAIDAIAKDSWVFENAFSQASYTLASTMSIFTSLYPSSHGVLFVYKDKLSPRVQTMPEIFNLYGYNTAWFSILKNKQLDLDAGFGRGFQDKEKLDILFDGRDDLLSWIKKNTANKFFLAMDARRVHDYFLFLGNQYSNGDYLKHKDKIDKPLLEVEKAFYRELVKLAKDRKPPLDDPKLVSGHKELFNGRYNIDKTERIIDLVSPEKRGKVQAIRGGLLLSWVKKTAKKDPQAWIAAYDACIQAVDKELIQPIIEELKASGIYDKTMIVITADHGEAFGEHGLYGHGNSFFDEFNHVPLIIKMPYSKQAKKTAELAQSVDIMPTLLEAAGIKVPHQAQGRSLLSLMAGANPSPPPHEYILAETLEGKLVRSREWKFFMDSKGNKTLFHLSVDPKEQHNVYSENQAIAKDLESKLKQWEGSLVSYKDKEYPFEPQIDKAGQERIRKTGYW